MALICFASQKGAPGTTLTALATAAAWPVPSGRQRLVVEADPSGGVLAVRYQLGVEPGLVTLVAAARGGTDAPTVFRHAQELPGGLPVVTCPDSADQVHAALTAGGAELGETLAGLEDVDVIADIGRFGPGSPAVGLVRAAAAVLMVARPTAEQLQPAARRLRAFAPETKAVGWVLVGDGPHEGGEVEDTYGFPVVAAIPHDPRAAGALEGQRGARAIRRTPLVRSAATLAANLTEWLNVAEPPGTIPKTSNPEPDERPVAAPLPAIAGDATVTPLRDPTPVVEPGR